MKHLVSLMINKKIIYLIEKINKKILLSKNSCKVKPLKADEISKDVVSNVYYLISVAGAPNLGDEWITIVWLNKIFKEDPYARVILDIPHEKTFNRLFPEYRNCSRLVVINNIWEKIKKLHNSDFPKSILELHKVLNFDDFGFSRLQDKYGRIKGVHLLGGGYINDIWINNALIIQVLSDLRSKFNFKLSWSGACIAPISDFNVSLNKKGFESFDYISTRDIESYDAIRNLEITKLVYGYDDVYLGCLERTVNAPEITHSKPNLYINIQGDISSKVKINKQIECISSFIKNNRDWFNKVIYLEGMPIADRYAYKILNKVFKDITLIDYFTLINKTIGVDEGLKIPKNSICIASRFHIHFYMSLFGIRGGYLCSHDSYYDIKHSSLCKIGSGWSKFEAGDDFKQFASANYNTEEIFSSKLCDYNFIYK